MRRRAVFLDKDGTLVRDVPFNVDPARIELVPDALAACAMLARGGWPLFIVSNQPGVARGYFEERALAAAFEHLVRRLADGGVALSGAYWCPHDDGDGCGCRKPAPGLFRRAAREHRLDLARSWMIGDILDDVEAAHRAGCRAVLVDNGGETVWNLAGERRPDRRVPNLVLAARAILSADEPVRRARRARRAPSA
jgi:D-glycero-D-manno-heptose 1,7-bisphosphate phosphatase